MRIAVVVTARPSYAKLKTVIQALLKRGCDVQIIAAASALLERYGKVVDTIRQDFPQAPITEIWSVYEGANLVTSAKETGALVAELSGVLHAMQPDGVMVCADRHEVLGAAEAASYLHLRTIHVQGGERTGSIDDRVRDSITALSDYHFTATEGAKYRVYGLTGSDHIWNVGCPSIDLAKQTISAPPVSSEELGGTGPTCDLSRPFIVVLQHPVTNEPHAGAQMYETLEAIRTINLPRIVFWPGQDSGAEHSSKVIREWVQKHPHEVIRTVRTLPPSRFLRLISQAGALVGNSSCGIRESSFLGTPVVNIGLRQFGRERASNVLDVVHDRACIATAIRAQLAHGRYPSSTLYGSGNAGEQIAEILCRS